jgi:hypothetical protein
VTLADAITIALLVLGPPAAVLAAALACGVRS